MLPSYGKILAGHIDPDQALNIIRNAEWHGYIEAAAQTALVYDYFLTLESEVRLIWNWPKSWITALFFANRYLAIVAQIVSTIGHIAPNLSYELYVTVLTYQEPTTNELKCHRLDLTAVRVPNSHSPTDLNCFEGKFSIAFWLIITSILQLIVTDGIVWLCVSALYGNEKRVKYPLLALFITSVVGSIAVVGYMGSKSKGTSNPAPELHRCVVTSTPYKLLWTFWIPIMVYELTTLVLVSQKLYMYLNKKYDWSSKLLETILKDTALYLVLIMALFIGDAVLFANPDSSLAGVLVPVSLVALSVLGSRMLFNLRAQSAANLISKKSEGSTTRVQTGDEIRFGTRGGGTTTGTVDTFGTAV